MEDLEVVRKALRVTFTKILSNLNQHLEADPLAEDEVKLCFDLLSEKFRQLEELDKTIFENMVNSKMSECEMEVKIHETDEYKMKFLRAKLETDKKLTKSVQQFFKDSGNEISNPFVKCVEGNRVFLLPKLEIKKFNGNIKDWLYFWNQFKKIHEDQTIAKDDKFQYLIHAMEKDSKASELVQSYPCSVDNYDKAISALKIRFGRDELLIEIYVRSLLELVLQNATKSGQKIAFSKTYDQLQSYINALESLNVTADKSATIVCTLVESSLPRDILCAWKKYHVPMDTNVTENRLWKLMEFLRVEVEHEERVSLDKKSFHASLEKVVKKEQQSKKKKKKKAQNSSAGFVSFLAYSARKLFRVLIRKIA